jgi:hypothetical protein
MCWCKSGAAWQETFYYQRENDGMRNTCSNN